MATKTALVTGGARRLGANLCQHLSAQGYDIALHYNSSRSEAQAVADGLCSTVHLLQADLAQASGVQQLWHSFRERFSGCDLFVHNASVFADDNLATLTYADWSANLHLHCWSAIASLQELARQERSSRAILLLDTRIQRNDSDYLSYNLSKRMLADLCRRSAAFLAPKVRVNAIAPGPILPSEADADAFASKLQALPIPEQVQFESIRLGLDYLLLNDSVAGEILYIDGGEHLL